jgi:hypothetical protein
MSNVGQHLLSGNPLRYPLLPDIFSTFFPRRSFRTLVHPPLSTLYVPPFLRVLNHARPHEAPSVDLIKTRLQQGDASLRTKSAFTVLMRTNLTFLSVQSSRCHSLHDKFDRFFLRGTRPLARHIRIVDPVHPFAPLLFVS